jgi:hypothetical protein
VCADTEPDLVVADLAGEVPISQTNADGPLGPDGLEVQATVRGIGFQEGESAIGLTADAVR